MKNRAYRREKTMSKFVSRLKFWYKFEGYLWYSSWQEYLQNQKWLYKHKHNKFRHRSLGSTFRKRQNHKRERVEGRKIISTEQL